MSQSEIYMQYKYASRHTPVNISQGGFIFESNFPLCIYLKAAVHLPLAF